MKRVFLSVALTMVFASTYARAECAKGGKEVEAKTEKECKAAGGKWEEDDYCEKGDKRIPAKSGSACKAAGGTWVDKDGDDK